MCTSGWQTFPSKNDASIGGIMFINMSMCNMCITYVAVLCKVVIRL